MNQTEPMNKGEDYVWKITGSDLPPVYILADSFDEALKFARRINPNYNTGYIEDEEALNF